MCVCVCEEGRLQIARERDSRGLKGPDYCISSAMQLVAHKSPVRSPILLEYDNSNEKLVCVLVLV